MHDGILNFQGSIYRGHHFGMFQVYYGANFSLGSYSVNQYHHGNTNIDTLTINRRAGNKFFGGAGGIGGTTWLLP